MQRIWVGIAALAAVLVGARTARAAQACGITPVLLVVQDRSASMNDAPGSSGGSSKWTTASQVVPQVLGTYQTGFDYGLMVYPDTRAGDVCAAGYDVLGVGSTPAQIQATYQATSPAGATPTATTLLAARDYLNSLNLSVPAYVLLITDGQPNCNANLDGNTCTCTPSTHGCDVSNGGTQYNCLDDTRTESAAAAVRAAGYPVYVVGFGASSTVNNNTAVLDTIASMGGTNHSYSALDTAGLQSAMNQIVGGVTGCCTDTCSPNALTCDASGATRKCEVQASGCYDWSTYPCASGSTCSNGSCQSCTSTCAAGQSTCNGNGVSTCVADANGCTHWSGTQACAGGELCGGGSCQSCNSTCSAGAQQCAGNGDVLQCQADANGCTSWVDVGGCGAGTTCAGGVCSGCNSCTVGHSQCVGDVPLTCADQGNGCSDWVPGFPCSGSQVCSNGMCLDCSGACTEGATRCGSVNGVETCTAQPGACNTWVSNGACGDGELCADGACCEPECNPGASRCGSDGSLQTCDDSSGCAHWAPSACAAGLQCSDGQCLQPCNGNGELSDCPEGQVCTDTGNGHFCYGTGGSSGSTGATGNGSASASTGGTGSNGSATTGGGSGGSAGSTSGSAGAGGTTGVGVDSGGTSASPAGNGNEVTSQGCGCGATSGTEALLALPFALVLLARRRRAA
jgi:hypothetical protein